MSHTFLRTVCTFWHLIEEKVLLDFKEYKKTTKTKILFKLNVQMF